MTAAAAVVAVLVVTVVLIWFLQPDDKSGSQQPSISTPMSVPQATLPADVDASGTTAAEHAVRS